MTASAPPLLGVLFIGTGRYIDLFAGFHAAFDAHFCADVRRRYFVFSDSPPPVTGPDVVWLPTPREPWPLPTLHRYDYFLQHAAQLAQCTHLVFANANLRPVVPLSFSEFFDGQNELFGVRHPGFAFKRRKWLRGEPGTFETNRRSTAHVGRGDRVYFAGGLNGGTTTAWLRLSGFLSANIAEDKKNRVNGTGWAVWHDESQINHYFNRRQRPRVLGAEYLYPEGWTLPVEPRILILDKDKLGGHAHMRSIDADAGASG